MEVVQTQIDYPRGLTFEQVWASLQETDKRGNATVAATKFFRDIFFV